MTFYKVRSKKQLQELSAKHKALKDRIRAENEAELTSTEERLYDVGKIFRPLIEQTLTSPLKQFVSDAPAAAAPAAVPPAAIQAAPARRALPTPQTPRTPILRLAPLADTTTVKIDINKDMDIDTIKKHKFPLPSEILEKKMPEADIESIIEHAKTRNKTLGQQKKGKEDAIKQTIDEEINKIRNYYDRLSLLVKSKSVTEGMGLPLQSKNILRNNRLGNLMLKFNGNSVEAYDTKTGTLVYQDTVDDSLFDLLSKKYYKNKKYTRDALLTYAKLIDLAFGSGKMPRNKKMTMVNKLRLLLASKQAGNTGVDDQIQKLLAN